MALPKWPSARGFPLFWQESKSKQVFDLHNSGITSATIDEVVKMKRHEVCGIENFSLGLAPIVLLGGSWVVISGVISRVTILSYQGTYIRGKATVQSP